MHFFFLLLSHPLSPLVSPTPSFIGAPPLSFLCLRYAHFLTGRMDAEMEIIDGHMHLWSPATHPWLSGVKDGGHPAGKFGR